MRKYKKIIFQLSLISLAVSGYALCGLSVFRYR